MTPRDLTADLLRTMPLPQPDGGSKDKRGSVLVVAGSLEVPGAALLAGTAALQAGAGKLQMAILKSAALHLAMAVPEAMVLGLAETGEGELDYGDAESRLGTAAEKVDAILIGPGMKEGPALAALTAALCAKASAASILLDAAALCDLKAHADRIRSRGGRVVITPHAGEMAQLLDRSRDSIEADPLGAAEAASTLLQAVVVMKGAKTHVVSPTGEAWLYQGGGVGLGTSGSGDVLAGLIVGLLARGSQAAQAALWGVHLHGQAGSHLARTRGTLGFLARDLASELPRLMSASA